MLSLIFLELTLRDVLADIPHDAGAILTYALLAVFIGFIWAGSRNKAPGRGAARKPTGGARGH